MTKSQSLVEAALWLTRLQEAGADASAAFETWLSSSPEHAAAWRQVHEPWALIGEHSAAPELVELRRAALSDARNQRQARSPSTSWFASTSWLGWRSRAAVAAVVLCITVGGLLLWRSNQADAYRTLVGERRTVTLVDGSTITLDSQSEVRVRYTRSARDLTLTRGQARFEVAHDVERPFSVVAGGQKVVATGTVFNVDLLGSKVLVTLIEGHVVVLPQGQGLLGSDSNGGAAAQPSMDNADRSAPRLAAQRSPTMGSRGVELLAGEQLVASSVGAPMVERVNVDRATAWQNGDLIFDNEALSSVITRVNRYTKARIELTDASTAELKISGVFHTGDVEGFVRTISSYLPVRVIDADDRTIRIAHR
jgi:transmembrane sensor